MSIVLFFFNYSKIIHNKKKLHSIQLSFISNLKIFDIVQHRIFARYYFFIKF